jgi:CheY-like chemotaxis protein
MPNKDGYQACKEIRRWEKKHGYKRHPIVALSANVLGDVYAKCVEAGFNSYVTKPVAFKELSLVMTKFLDPPDKTKSPELLRLKKKWWRAHDCMSSTGHEHIQQATTFFEILCNLA